MTGFFNQKNTLLLNHSIQSKYKEIRIVEALYDLFQTLSKERVLLF
jgi:hypothetical protein